MEIPMACSYAPLLFSDTIHKGVCVLFLQGMPGVLGARGPKGLKVITLPTELC